MLSLVALAALSLAVAACGSSKAPAVASIAATTTSPSPSPKTGGTAPKADATELLAKWGACMRKDGDPNQTDPTIDNHWGINVTIPMSAPQSLSGEVHGGTAPCNQYLAAASAALRAAHPAPPPPADNATGVKYSTCMRANGVPNYPDPTGSTTNLRNIDTNSPFFIRANKVCGKQIGAPSWWINGWGPPGNISVSNIPPGGLPPSGANRPRTTTTTPSG